MANNFTPVGAELQVNTILTGQQFDSDLTVGTDGRFIVAFEHLVSATNLDVYLQFVNADGTRSGNSVLIAGGAGSQLDPVVVARPGGGAMVVWDADAASEAIHYSLISSTGVVGGPTVLIDATRPLSLPDAARLEDGRTLVVADLENLAPGGREIAFRFVGANGLPAGDADLLESGAGDQTDAAVAASGNKALVVYRDESLGTEGQVVGRLYDGTGTEPSDFSAEFAISTGLESPSSADVAALTDGRYIVVWENTNNDDIEGRFVSAAGVALGSVFTITNISGDNESPSVAALPDGGFMVAWENDGGLFPTEDNSDNDAVVARRFDSKGKPAGDLFLVNTGDPDTTQDDPAIAVNLATGRALITWDDSHPFTGTGQDNDPTGIRGRAYEVTNDVVLGTDDVDLITTYGIAEEIRALKGNDRVRAGAGDDVVNGGKGSDDLFGEAGVDTFVFDNRKGVDTLDWANGERLHFDSDVFKKPNKLGKLKKKFFEKGKEADDGNDYFVFNKQKGLLYYDSNADGAGKMKLIAKLDKGSDLDAGEIFLI
jgi:hypothetical protein